jgi:hypothetical protein
MSFGPVLVGSVLAVPFLAFFDRFMYQPAVAEAARLGKTVAPEKRLYPSMLGVVLFPISLFW